jgi:hypothetical protein
MDVRDTGGEIQLLGCMLKCAIVKDIFDFSVGPKNPLALKAGRHRLCCASDQPHNGKAMLDPCIASLKANSG